MTNRSLPGYFDPFGPMYDRNDGRANAAHLVQRLLRPAASETVGWDPTSLECACRTLVASRDGSIRRIHTVIPCPQQPLGVMPVVEYAQTLANRCGLQVHCNLKDNTVTVTFEFDLSE